LNTVQNEGDQFEFPVIQSYIQGFKAIQCLGLNQVEFKDLISNSLNIATNS